MCLNIIEPSNPNVEKRAKVDIVQIKKEITKGRTSSIKSFTSVIQDFQPSEKEYWGKYGIDEDTLQRYNVHSLKSVSFTKKKVMPSMYMEAKLSQHSDISSMK